MEGKGLIKFFLILMALICGLQLLYFLPTNKVEKNAAEYAESRAQSVAEVSRDVEYKIAKNEYLDSMSGEKVFSIPMIADYTYSDLKQRQLALGLDLKGGMSSVLEVNLKDLLVALAGSNSRESAFQNALAKADEAKRNSQSDYITLFADAYKSLGATKSLARVFQRSEALGDINIETTDGEVVRMLRTKADETVELTFKMLKERIDKLGVTQPNISLDKGRDLILVEMPGIENQQRAREFLEASAKLEFWDTYRFTDAGIADAFFQADQKLASMMDMDLSAAQDSVWEISEYDDDGNPTDSVKVAAEQDLFANQGPLLSLLQVNGANNRGYSPTVMGLADKNKMTAISEMLERPEVKGLFPKNAMFSWSYKPFKDYETGELTKQYELYLIKKQAGSDKAPLEGDVVVSASQSLDPNTGEPDVTLVMDARGAKQWTKMTTNAYNNGGREIAITLDDQVVSAPGVNNGPITGGRSQITGNFNVQEANDFASILEVGKLPATVEIIQSSTVGPTLGAANIKSSMLSLLVGALLLLAFVVFYYAGGGLVALVALLVNIFFVFGTLSSLGTVLTLPGFAGIILTIGMAVDANVIIFERIKEELRAGKSNLAAISDGFKASYSAIIDANVTTLLVAFVLSAFGLGPIKGFAVVLIVGVFCSLLTAVLFGKLLIDWYTGKGKEMSFWTGLTKNAFANLQVDWMGKRKIAYIISGSLIAIGLVSMFTRGFDLGVDFKGGYSYTVEFADESLDAAKIKTTLDETFESSTIVKAVDTDNTYSITTTYLVDANVDDADEQVLAKLHGGLTALTGSKVTIDDLNNSDFKGDIKILSSNKVGATIADDIRNSSWKAGLLALLLIFVYILIRFSKWQYSLGAVAALFHDSLIVLGLFSLARGFLPFSLEIDQTFIAAILTVIGYSINDTVVVFDRIREFLGIYTNKSKDEVLNMAINSTFSRTIITSFTTLIVVLILLFFGGSSIKGFAFALVVGILVGTYSSIFVATPIVRDLSDDLRVKRSAAKAASDKKSFGRAAAAKAE